MAGCDRMFVVEDETHSEWCGRYEARHEAISELQRRASLPWNHEANIAPCASWQTCGRKFFVIEFDSTVEPWRELRRDAIFEISAAGVVWHLDA